MQQEHKRKLDELQIDWAEYQRNCIAKGPSVCNCPFITFTNADGYCYHRACEGPHFGCGVPVAMTIDY